MARKAQAAVDAPQPAEPQQSAEYTGSDGRPKATFEQAFRVGHGDYGGQKMPWQLSWQRNERTLKFTDAINEHMVKGFAVKELHISEDEMEHRLQQLSLLLPDLAAKISVMKPKAVAYFAADTNRLALALVELKRLFPTADVANMVVKQPALLIERSPQELAVAAEKLRELLPRFDIDWLLERHPQIALDVDTFAETLAEAQRMMPNQDVMHTLAHNPNMIFGFERRASMIPYDS